VENLLRRISGKRNTHPGEDNFPHESLCSAALKDKRISFLKQKTGTELHLLSTDHCIDPDCLEGKIENYIGMTQVPTGIVGPLHVLGSAACGDFYVPLATSEGALVASYHRGAKATRLCGGITSVCLVEGVQRSPVFKFNNLGELGPFLIWALERIDTFRSITGQSSRFAVLKDVKSNIEGNHLILTFEFFTGDASGQNMVTLCTDAICNYILANAPVKPLAWYIEGNYSGDKKATAVAFSNVRGKKVTAEAVISKQVLETVLRTSAQKMADYWQTSTIGVIQSGSIGAQGHFANALAALFLATGQDVACVAEAANGITRMEVAGEDLYVSVTLPNLIVGTVGGGTSLPTQNECLRLMECEGAGMARKYSEICAALVLSGEVSIAAALSGGQFSRAHKLFGRKKNREVI
jgi:hydroxymethylglutaryl-CoA reductase (NADPH)